MLKEQLLLGRAEKNLSNKIVLVLEFSLQDKVCIHDANNQVNNETTYEIIPITIEEKRKLKNLLVIKKANSKFLQNPCLDAEVSDLKI